MAPRTGKHWMNRWSVWASLKIEAPTTLAETWVSWGNFLCIKSLLITSVQGSSYCWCPFTQHATISPGSHHGAGTESDGIPVYAINLYGYFNRVGFLPSSHPLLRGPTHSGPLKIPGRSTGASDPSGIETTPIPPTSLFPTPSFQLWMRESQASKAYVILPSTCNRVDGESKFFFLLHQTRHFWVQFAATACVIP